jgi:hypothetical protein
MLANGAGRSGFRLDWPAAARSTRKDIQTGAIAICVRKGITD